MTSMMGQRVKETSTKKRLRVYFHLVSILLKVFDSALMMLLSWSLKVCLLTMIILPLSSMEQVAECSNPIV